MANEAKVKTNRLEKKWANIPVLSGEEDSLIEE